MTMARNVLFIMCDQLRADHLGCAGHPTLQTPNIDRLARRGVRFSNAFVQSPVCGPSRMSFYTGRYVFSHGASWNRVPLSLRELTIGDYLRPLGIDAALAGKTHVLPDEAALERFGIEGASALSALLRNGRFVELDRYDGHSPPGGESHYADFLRDHGYVSGDPWSDYVISVAGPGGEVLSGWNMRNVRHPARVAARHSETAYMTDQAMAFIRAHGDRPWFLHLSYVKPHWPYVAPAPYNDMHGVDDCLPVIRHPREIGEAHPVVAAYRQHDESVSFARDEVIETVRPVYMGLVRQIDDELGRLFALLEETGRWSDTLIVFTADHGDLLGDHWLGEKELFYESALRIPFILYDPDRAADATRGRVDERLVEGVDLLPTCLEALGIEIPQHLIEGRSLLAAVRGEDGPWRDFVVSELDYSFRKARHILRRRPRECRGWMIRDERWKYVLWDGFR
ncbi:MAG: sulfatase-like hydrolase/transferase, partial [Alphaproteobacteria bacterium]|nr:sulfatase-like hydrolase/transferase [Alphaproteobacteria bacterium]